MLKKTLKGWLFDVYPSKNGITIWLIDEDGVKYLCYDSFAPEFYLNLNDKDLKRAENIATCLQSQYPITFERTKKIELYSNEELTVLSIKVRDTQKHREVVSIFEKYFPPFAFFNSDVPIAQLYLYSRGLFPLAYGEYFIDERNKLTGYNLLDSRDAFEYKLPPLSIMQLRNANNFVPPGYKPAIILEVTYEGRTYVIEQQDEIIETLNWHIHRFDPDIILTEYGDSTLIPLLISASERLEVPLLFNRDVNANYITTRESSFFQYGRVVHKDGAFEFAGRWHIDIHNSFTVAESYLDGLYDIARLTQIPIQRQARASIGTGLSSIQLSWAHQNGVLIPAKKREPEEFKPASTLLLADRGGLIFQPPIGYHENVAELDFVSMYPTIMVVHNISPETINCRCCNGEGKTVPELGYRICGKRQGIVPQTLRSVLQKRAYYKKKKQELKATNNPLWQIYDRRQSALKWMLVTCFGYLGYKNARFGKIEAHESVNAFSRDAILQAKEIAESNGFTLLHAIIDCMWLKKEGATETDYLMLCKEIEAKVGIDISLEGIYNWILFPASKMDVHLPTANRYVGCYRNGELKIRGIEVRRKDTPRFIKNMQMAMLQKFSEAKSLLELDDLLPQVLEIVVSNVSVLRSGKVNPMELVIKKHISQEADEYANNSISAVVTKMLQSSGINLAPGESIEFIIIDQSGKSTPEKAKPLSLYAFEDGYDIEKYTELALKTAETMLLPFGYDIEKLKNLCGIVRKKKKFKKVPELNLFD